MEQIRARIREKRGVDYTEQQIRELAAVKLEKFLDPRGVRSDLLEQFRRMRPPVDPPELPNYAFDDDDAVRHAPRADSLDPPAAAPDPEAVLQPEPADPGAAHPVAAQHDAGAGEAEQLARGPALDQLTYEVMHNLVLEDDAHGHRGEEPQDAGRVADQPSRVQRAARARARERRRLQGAGAGRARIPAAPPPSAARLREPRPRRAATRSPSTGRGRRPRRNAGRQPRAGRPRRALSRRRARRRDPASAAGAVAGAAGRRGGASAAQRHGSAPMPDGRPRRRRTGAARRRPTRQSRRSSPSPSTTAGPADSGPTADPSPTRHAVKLAIVVQRYGPAINGGAELHARYIAEHLARHAEVEVLTTCATRLRHVAQRAARRRRAP